MKTSTTQIVAVCLAATLSATIAQSKFSGIYSGNTSEKEKVVLAITKGGHVFGMGNSTRGLKEAIDPNRSTISSSGSLKAIVADGTTITGTVSSDFALKGTIKSDGETFRISASRTLN